MLDKMLFINNMTLRKQRRDFVDSRRVESIISTLTLVVAIMGMIVIIDSFSLSDILVKNSRLSELI